MAYVPPTAEDAAVAYPPPEGYKYNDLIPFPDCISYCPSIKPIYNIDRL